MTDDPAILYTTAIGLLIGTFAVLRTLATEREHRIEELMSIAKAERAQQEQKQISG